MEDIEGKDLPQYRPYASKSISSIGSAMGDFGWLNEKLNGSVKRFFYKWNSNISILTNELARLLYLVLSHLE